MSHEAFEQLLDELLDAGIFAPTEGGELRPTEPFRRSRAEHRAELDRLDDDAFESALSAYVTGDASVSRDTLGDAMAIDHAVESIDKQRSLLAAQALERVEREPASEVPAGFVPIDGEEIDAFVRSYPAAVVYFWREECDPCGETHDHLALLAEETIPERVGLAAVYGPEWADLLDERYQVSVAPTTVFCVDGRIDSRLVGNPGYEAFRIETETIVDAID